MDSTFAEINGNYTWSPPTGMAGSTVFSDRHRSLRFGIDQFPDGAAEARCRAMMPPTISTRPMSVEGWIVSPNTR